MNQNVMYSLQVAFMEMWQVLIVFLPQIIVAILILVIGWLVAGVFSSLIQRMFRTFRLTEALDKAGVDTLTERAGYQFKPADFVGSLVFWSVFLVFVVVALDILELTAITNFFTNEVLTYIPRVIVASFILLGAIVVARLVSESVMAAARSAGMASVTTIGWFARYAILVFAVLAALHQLQIATELIQLLFAGIVFAGSLAFGLAFGLGGRDAAARYLDRWQR